MTKEEFEVLQLNLQQSGKSVEDYLHDIISQMPYHTKASYEEFLQLLPHKWKLKHPESVMTKTA